MANNLILLDKPFRILGIPIIFSPPVRNNIIESLVYQLSILYIIIYVALWAYIALRYNIRHFREIILI